MVTCIVMKPALILGLSIGLCFAAQAQPTTETVVVTGTRTPKLLADSPVRVDVIDNETISRLSRGTLRQVLDVIPGVTVERTVKDGYTVQLQGFDGDHVLILLNGQPLITPTGTAVDLDQVSVSNILQIEVIHGAASVLYGSNAMGGVINIITDTTEESFVQMDIEVDSYLENNSEQAFTDNSEFGNLLRLLGGGNIAGFHSRINLQYVESPSYDFDQTTVSENGAKLEKQFAGIELSRDFSGIKTQWKTAWFDESKIKLSALIPGQSTPLSYGSQVEQWQHDLRFSGEQHWKLSMRYSNHQETSGNSNAQRQTDIGLMELDAQKVWMGEESEWVAGLVLHQDTLDQVKLSTNAPEVDDADRQSVESYLQLNQQWDSSQLLLGVRVQNDSDFGWHQAVRASGSHRLETESGSWKLLGGIGQSYRVPSLKERKYQFDHSNLGYMIIGVDNLVPETANSVNLGLNGKMDWDNWSISTGINMHYSDTEDFIDTRLDVDASEPGLNIYVYDNIEQAELSGIDLSFGAEHQAWKYDLGYSYLHAVNNHNQRLSDRPRHLLKFSLTHYFFGTDGQFQLYGTYKMDIAGDAEALVAEDDSLIINAVFQYEVMSGLTWRLGVENLFDTHLSPQNQQQGLFDARSTTSRRLYTGLTYRFDN